MVDPLSTPQQRAALVWEVTDAAVTLGHGLRTLGSADFRSLDAGAVFSLLAMGCEKLLKLSRGALGLDEDAKWPNLKAWGHRIHELNTYMVDAITRRKDLSTATGEIDRLLQQVGQDRHLDAMLAALQRYAVNGRFHQLDLLAGTVLHEPSPAGMWHDLEVGIMRTNPTLLTAVASPDSYQQGREGINAVIVGSLSGWIELYYRAWVTGVLGEVAKPWAGDLRAELRRLKTPGW